MPKPIRSLNSHRVDAIDPGQGKIQSVLRVKDDHVIFTCTFNKRTAYFDFKISDRKTGEEIAAILKKYRGKTLISISMIELSANEEAA
jgi:hypothetical protein